MASLLFSLTTVVVLVFPAACQSLPTPTPISWKLALHWPNSFCSNNGVNCSQSVPKDAFVIRTLLGVNEKGEEMTCFDPQSPLDPSLIARLTPTLSLVWPDLQGNNFRLWEKEWQKRAACFGFDPAFYFVNAINLKDDIDQQIVDKGFGGVRFSGEQVFGALSRQGVQLGNTYLATTLAEKVSSKYGEALELLCDDDSSEVNQLLEYHMCATADAFRYTLVPCRVQKTLGCKKAVRFT